MKVELSKDIIKGSEETEFRKTWSLLVISGVLEALTYYLLLPKCAGTDHTDVSDVLIAKSQSLGDGRTLKR